ncbi:MAG: ABC transporter permease [Bdellovibrionota bacterium]
MSAYIIRRVIQVIIMMFVLSFICYYMLSLMPGDPVDILASSNPKITTGDIERLKALYGLDKPAYVRYGNWLNSFIHGDFGYSRTYRIPVMELIGPRLFNTFILSLSSLLLSLVLGVAIGVYAGLKPGGKFDYLANLCAYAGISTPAFWLAIVLIILFSVAVPIFPAGGTITVGTNLQGFAAWLDRGKYLVLPILSLTALQAGVFVRFARSSMMEAMGYDFIRTARAKGLNRRVVVWKHAFRNALIPLLTIVALSMSNLFSGAVLTETVFAYQGVGSLIYKAIIESDFNVAMVSFLVSIFMVLIMNLIADLLYAAADPRITYD